MSLKALLQARHRSQCPSRLTRKAGSIFRGSAIALPIGATCHVLLGFVATSLREAQSRRLKIMAGACPIPHEPGLGIEIEEKTLSASEPFRFSEMPHLRRRDGSVANW